MKHNSPTRKKTARCMLGIALSAAFAAPIFFNTMASINADAADFTSEYSEFGLDQAMQELNLQIAEEGAVLLKNKDKALPLGRNERNVTVYHSIYDEWTRYEWNDNVVGNMEIGGSGNGGSGGILPHNPKDMYQGLQDSGFNVNPAVKRLYDLYPTDYDNNTKEQSANTKAGPNVDILRIADRSVPNFNDAAIITISRQSGEGSDVWGNWSFFDSTQQGVKHYLELNSGEKELIQYAKSKFNKIIVLLNTGMPLEVAELEDDDDIDAVVWVGLPGENGLLAIGSLLSGSVNFSGRLVDTWAADFTKDPTYVNMGSGEQLDEVGPGKHNDWINNGGYGMHSVDYAEGIYVGYKFYETAATVKYYDETEPQQGNDMPKGVSDRYYNRTNGVVYPFGYGLSYTTFSQEIVSGTKKTDGDKIEFDVKVTNNGSVAGKDVVEVYYNPPYIDGGIEKASANLVAYAKTSLIQPGGNETVHISFDKRDMASFDYNDANKNGHKGYELDNGNYVISINSDSHKPISQFTYSHTAAEADQKATYFDYDAKTGKKIETLFSNNDTYNVDRTQLSKDGSGVDFMSRASISEAVGGSTNPFVVTFPKVHPYEEGVWNGGPILTDEAMDLIFYKQRGNQYYTAADDSDQYPWYMTAEDIPDGWTQAADTSEREGGYTAIQLKDMIGIPLEGDTKIEKEGSPVNGMTYTEAWTAFMNQLTYDEISILSNEGYFQTAEIAAIGKPGTDDNDGPAQLRNHDSTEYSYGFACGVVLASTWNVKLAEEFGERMGDWALQHNMTGWYGPSMNLHRSPFCGRNYEYFSEDALVAGKTGAAAVKGASSKGLISYIKHFAMNNQEYFRANVCVWSNEQAMRELYLKCFEPSFKEGGSMGVMTAMNNIGAYQCAMNYNLTVKLLREEWGYTGIALCDFTASHSNWMVRTQVLPLSGDKSGLEAKWDAEKGYPVYNDQPCYTEWYAARKVAQFECYTIANSNATSSTFDFSIFSDFNDYELTWKQGQNGYTSELRMKKGGNFADHYYFDVEYYNDEGEKVTWSGEDQESSIQLPFGEFYYNGDTIRNDLSTPGDFNFKLTSHVNGGSKTINVTIHILDGYKLTASEARQGIPFESSVVVVDDPSDFIKSDGVYHCKIESGALPAGLTLSADGLITGTPTESGTFEVGINIADGWHFKTTITVASSYAATFDMNDGWQQSVTTYADADGKATLPTEPTRAGYTFDGWYTDAACSEKADLDAVLEDDVTYYAKWTAVDPESLKGETGATGPQGAKGETGAAGPKGDTGAAGKDGTNGQDGKDGVTPQVEIGENGNWFINGQDTGVKAAAETGGGCGGVIGIGGAIVATVTILGAAVLVIRKKKD